MSELRFKALEETHNRVPVAVNPPSDQISGFFGENIFGRQSMREFLAEDIFKKVTDAIDHGHPIDRKIADHVAAGMKAWAISKRATHFTHWFQPLHGLTAEKHDSFFNPIEGGRSIERFEGSQLVQQEPDASSFPSGGLRSTFEARGYTAWDPSSPAFITGKTLCVPSVYISYTGEALDYKTPLLRALSVLDKAATDVCQYFDKNVTRVIATLGWEQEYFLIDKAFVDVRPDLLLTGRTLFGMASARGQQLEDHYFGSIPERAMAFIHDFETEAYKLGIPVRTRHNEVAPNQFECAPVFEEVNLSVDHNQQLMDLMDRVSRRHNLRVLLHEKPFAGINGSGKHNNWSMATNTGRNLLSPGKTPKNNLMFLTFFINAIKAVHDHANLLRASIASANNDHRLGANEAPPAIMSIFIGNHLNMILDEIVKKVKKEKMTPEEKSELKLNIGKIPEILIDNTDRNRTSPFAFTGNKFEFRAVGSSANCASAMTVLNTIVADRLTEFNKEVDSLLKKGEDKDEAILHVLRNYIVSSKRILFDGNNYSADWVKEAEKRGLSNINTTPLALDFFVKKDAMHLFEKHHILNEREIHARYEIELENYMKRLQIESRLAGEIAMNQIIPAAVKYQNLLIENVRGLKMIFEGEPVVTYAVEEAAGVVSPGKQKKKSGQTISNGSAGTATGDMYSTQVGLIRETGLHIGALRSDVKSMVEERKKANSIDNIREKAGAYCDKVKPYLASIRKHADKLEMTVDNELWPLAKYREMLFTK
ncbi:MAG: glutamine synthetase III [Bacteroidetes bacterium]|nr:glutamine synthetase III [Bacteroidota bacterium]